MVLIGRSERPDKLFFEVDQFIFEKLDRVFICACFIQRLSSGSNHPRPVAVNASTRSNDVSHYAFRQNTIIVNYSGKSTLSNLNINLDMNETGGFVVSGKKTCT